MKNENGRAGASQPLCPLCSGESERRFALPHTQTWHCRKSDCDLEFANPQLDDAELDQAYASLYYPGGNGNEVQLENTPEWDIRHFFEKMSGHFGSLQGKRLLDYGCGNGRLLRVASAMGARVTGIEQSGVAREEAARSGCRVYADIASLRAAEPEARFDWIVLFTVIEHLRRPWADVEDLSRLLADGGTVIVNTMNTACLKSRLRGATWDQRLNLTHFYYFTPKALGAALRRAGLEDVRELPAITDYSGHGVGRRFVQRMLGICRLQGGLLFSGRARRHAGAARA